MFLSMLLLCGSQARAGGSDESCPAVPVPALSLPITRAALIAGRPITIVTLGSSSTAGVGASSPEWTYPALLEKALRAAWPDHRVKVINQGMGGQEADTMEARLEHDAIAADPVLVIWQVGSNAALKHMPPDKFDHALSAGLDKLSMAGVDVVLMDSQQAPRIDAAPDHGLYDAATAQQARQHRDSLFSRNALMERWKQAGVQGLIGPDNLHHSDRGYACLASVLAKAIIDAADDHVSVAVEQRR
ncbi:MAG TPA: SGNH/GDSL hydrolase family protein [Rhodopila sp.]|nr:SGNH/GDSL hydrolase family protein [Rhodopila sp.]